MGERRQIGHYEVVRLLGEDGMSEVYEVEDPRLGSRHALKLFAYHRDDSEVRVRFLTEGRLLARLSHPRIVKVTDFGVDESSARPYFVMDLVLNASGETQLLSDVESGTVDEARIGIWYDDLREGLAYIHGQGVIHRDLKLQNILVGPDGHVVLADFGIARVLAPKGAEAPVVDAVQTIMGVSAGKRLVMGSIGYMAPELEMGVAATPQSDWYALGIIVYRLLTGTWFDSRTDFMGMLEGYDPIWKRIVPKLLHENPNGRECLSYDEEKRIARGCAEAEAEARLDAAMKKGRVAHVVAWGLLAVVLSLVVALAVLVPRHMAALEDLQNSRAVSSAPRRLCSFDSLFGIPPNAKSEDVTDDKGNLVVPSESGLEAARVDLLILTHGLLERYNAGGMTPRRLIDELEKIRKCFEDDGDPTELWPLWEYNQYGEAEVIHWLLERAVEKLEEKDS